MRVVVAPRAFRGTLTASAAAAAIAEGWRRTAPGDELLVHPLDEGPDGPDGLPGGLVAVLPTADLVLTGEGSLEYRSLSGTPLAALAILAASHDVPCLVLAGQVHVGGRVALEAGIHGAYAAAADAGSVDAALADPGGTLTTLAAGVAEHWGGRDGPSARPRPGTDGDRPG